MPTPTYDTLADRLPADVVRCLEDTEQSYLNSIDRMGSVLKQTHCSRPLVVIDRRAVTASNLSANVQAALADFDCQWFDEFTPNPTSDEALRAANAAAEHRADSVIAIGGGTCLDVAKMAALAGSENADRQRDVCRGGSTESLSPLPLMAAPSTSGTGSEATQFAAIYVDGRKQSISDERMRPAVVIMDPRLHAAMPASIAACTGMDALSQAIESLWAVGRTEISARYAHAGGRLIAECLVPSVCEADEGSRFQMMWGAHLAGQAINISKTTASHALSYQLTQRFGIAHGHAVALTLGPLAAANATTDATNCNDPRGAEAVCEHVDQAASVLNTTPAQMPGVMSDLLRQIGLPNSLSEAGIGENRLAEIAASVDPVRLGNNPRRLDTTELHELLRRGYTA
ncbi:phosphonoacetaldehyde reductase [Crateriforma spongiae]|uniref:phosphonoacetaldehyde reductase n=1 Tax=Crateriforma spongiae TaxID=2724528 RepID=UPI00144523FB|nr:phosphonoacetaldehyde reductase [Crateriforma spongiae]